MSEAVLSPKTREKRRKILDVSLKVFAKEGFRNTDVQVIADRAGVGKGTVYRHFGNKEQLFLATVRSCLDRMREFIERKVGGEWELPALVAEVGTAEHLRRIARACAEFYQRHPQAVEVMIQERAEFRESVFPSHLMFRAETRGGFDRLLQSAMERGELRTVDVNDASDAFGDLLYGCVVNGCLGGGRARLVERVERAVDIFLNGLIAPNGPVGEK